MEQQPNFPPCSEHTVRHMLYACVGGSAENPFHACIMNSPNLNALKTSGTSLVSLLLVFSMMAVLCPLKS
jgi:hypothetical protein